MSFTKQQLAAAENGKGFGWSVRARPAVFEPIHVTQRERTPVVAWVDWWNPRSNLLCCLFPFLRSATNHTLIDGADADVWKRQLKNADPNCPDSMKGVFWLKYNPAPEELITMFGDAEFVGTFNEDGTDGYGEWRRPLKYNWTRDNSAYGLGFAFHATSPTSVAAGRMNLKDGICTVHGDFEGRQVVYRVDDDEWWKVHYVGDPGEEGEQEVAAMYKWLKILDKDGNKTKHWDEYVEWLDEPLPHENSATAWCPCWVAGFSPHKIEEIRVRPNPKQAVHFKH